MTDHRLFCYGTLEFPPVMRAVTGSDYAGCEAVLRGYARHPVRNEVFPGIVADPTGMVRGTLYRGMGDEVLSLLDVYESGLFTRWLLDVEVGGAGIAAWVYVMSPEGRDCLDSGDWDATLFARSHLARYLRSLGGVSVGLMRAPLVSL